MIKRLLLSALLFLLLMPGAIDRFFVAFYRRWYDALDVSYRGGN